MEVLLLFRVLHRPYQTHDIKAFMSPKVFMYLFSLHDSLLEGRESLTISACPMSNVTPDIIIAPIKW